MPQVVEAMMDVEMNMELVVDQDTVKADSGDDNDPREMAPQATRAMLQPHGPSALIGRRETERNKRNREAAIFLKRNLNCSLPPRPRPLYPDRYSGPGPTSEVFERMNDLDIRRESGGGGGIGAGRGRNRGSFNNPRKRARDDDESHDSRRRRRRYEQPIAARLRAEILKLADEPLRTTEDECAGIGREIASNFEDDQVRGDLLDTTLKLLLEQPLKIPHVAAVFLYANDANPEATKEMLARVAAEAQDAVDGGKWREFKLLLRFFACLQGILSEGGVIPILEQLFDLAADFQAASSSDAVGFELVKIILLTLPYAMAVSSTDEAKTAFQEKALELLEKTDIIASASVDLDPSSAEDVEAHMLKQAVNPFPVDSEARPFGYQSALYLLQEQLKAESKKGWAFACIPRLYKLSAAANGESSSGPNRQVLPTINLPSPANPGESAYFPEAFFSIYADQDLETVPRTDDIACSLIRDVIVDTVDLMDFNRIVVARLLIEIDMYWVPETFALRGAAIDKLKDLPKGRSTWKSEDVILDGVFSQIFKLPNPQHKLVYYHSIITELCRQSAGTIAPCLGRAMRWLFRYTDEMDLELAYRFMDWFSHHLSNFEFRWKWDEWAQFLDESDLHPKKAFIIGALDKEIRLSFARRVRDTLPKAYHSLITEGKEKDVPDFKYKFEDTPFAKEGAAIHALIRKKAPEEEVQKVIDEIHEKAAEQGLSDPLIQSTDAYMTSVCHIGSKSLSHVLSCIERCKDRLIKTGQESEPARRQIIQSVVDYWKDHPGIAVNIVDKLLNYTIVTPESVIVWALSPENLGDGRALSHHWRFEMVAVTIGKVTNRVRQIVNHKVQAGPNLPEEQAQKIDEVLTKERDEQMSYLFPLIYDSVRPVAQGSSDGMIESGIADEDAEYVKSWGYRWLKVFERKQLVEKCVVGPEAVATQMIVADLMRKLDARREKAQAEAEERKAAERAARAAAEEEALKQHQQMMQEEKMPVNGEAEADMGLDNLDVAPDNDMMG